MKKKELLAILKALIVALAADETPKPKPLPAPMVPSSGWTLTQNMSTGEIRVNGEPAYFIPQGYERQEDGYWMPWFDPHAR